MYLSKRHKYIKVGACYEANLESLLEVNLFLNQVLQLY